MSCNRAHPSLVAAMLAAALFTTFPSLAQQGSVQTTTTRPPSPLPIQGRLPSLAGAVAWLNSQPLTPEALEGTVVLVDF